MTPAEIESQLAQFEGLVFTTAQQIVAGGVELEFDDVRQILRIKVWKVIQKWDSAHTKKLPLRRYVFMCLANLRKDIEKRPRRYNASIDELRSIDVYVVADNNLDRSRADRFDGRYLSVDAEVVFREIEDEWPAWLERLTDLERQVVKLRCEGLMLVEIDAALGLARDRAKTAMQSAREKLADWRPSASEPRSVPTAPLPAAEPRTAPPPLAHAA